MISDEAKKPVPNLVGSTGMYYICYQLAKRGWNVMPTSRNAKGIDILIYSQDARKKYDIQVKSLTKKNPVPLGIKEDSNIFLADFLVICRNAFVNPEVFITKPENIRKRIHRGEREGRFSYWLDPKVYEEFRDN